MPHAFVTTEIKDRIATITIRRPQVMNALSCAAADALRDAVDTAGADEGVRTLVLTGEGKAFCTGFDLSSIDLGAGISLGTVLDDHFHPLIRAIRHCRKPVVTAINGPVAGVGVAVALAGDIAIANEDGYFLEPFINIGVVPDGGNTYMLPRLIGTARANAMMMLGERVSARDAADWGLIWKCVPADAFSAEIDRTAGRLSGLPENALAEIKRLGAQSSQNDFEAQIALERDAQESLGRQDAFQDAVARFVRR